MSIFVIPLGGYGEDVSGNMSWKVEAVCGPYSDQKSAKGAIIRLSQVCDGNKPFLIVSGDIVTIESILREKS